LLRFDEPMLMLTARFMFFPFKIPAGKSIHQCKGIGNNPIFRTSSLPKGYSGVEWAQE
jgi:hypothetical protein